MSTPLYSFARIFCTVIFEHMLKIHAHKCSLYIYIQYIYTHGLYLYLSQCYDSNFILFCTDPEGRVSPYIYSVIPDKILQVMIRITSFLSR